MFNLCSNETYNLRSDFRQYSLAKPNKIFFKINVPIERQNHGTNSLLTVKQNVEITAVNAVKSMLISHYRND
jgi:hypothetical protein